MGKSMRKTIILILFGVIVLVIGFFIWDQNKKQDSQVIFCEEAIYGDNGKVIGINESIKNNIPCLNDNECSSEQIENYCKPGFPIRLKCGPARTFCGDDGNCREYGCF